MRYWKEGLVFGACAAACAAPLLFGTAAAGLGAAGLGFLAWGEVGMLAAVAAVGVGLFLWRRTRRGRFARTGAACGCDTRCSTDNACDLPASAITEDRPSPPSDAERDRAAAC